MKQVRLFVLMLLLVLAGCAAPSTVQPPVATEVVAEPTTVPAPTTAEATAAPEPTVETVEVPTSVTVTDTTGREITVDLPVERVISVNRQVSEALAILQVDDRVVGTGDTTITSNPYLSYGDRPDVGATNELNIELILSLEPDVVFAHTNRDVEILEEKLEPAGIKVIRIDYYRPGPMDDELRLMATVMQAEERAEAYLAWQADIEAVRASHVDAIAEAERKSVLALSVGFLNSQGGYRVFPSRAADGTIGVGEGYATILAGGVDAGSDLEWPPEQEGTTVLVDEEYVLEKNPQVVTLHGDWLGGYNATDDAQYREVMANIIATTSLPRLHAAEMGDVYIFHTDYLGGNRRFIGVLQLAKYMYPEEFSDVDPDAYYREYFQDWVGVPYQGVWSFNMKDLDQ